MMNEWQDYIILDTETTGFRNPIFVVEIAAQKMRGIEPDGAPFHAIVNHGIAIPDEASRVNGYTREILDRDGDPPLEVYEKLSNYIGTLPVCAYNLAYDWQQVLIREWRRLGISPIGVKGFCFYELTQRLLDPVPCGNCKLQTIRQYYRLPERNAHSAKGDVDTVIDLLREVLHPITLERGLSTPADWAALCRETWFPSRIPFGKYKNRHYLEALEDPEFADWINWLGRSEKKKSRKMGKWYRARLDAAQAENNASASPDAKENISLFDLPYAKHTPSETPSSTPDAENSQSPQEKQTGAKTNSPADSSPSADIENSSAFRSITIYTHPQKAKLQHLVAISRDHLARVEAAYHLDQNTVEAFHKEVYRQLRLLYEREQRLRRLVEYRELYLDTLTKEGEDPAKEIEEEYQRISFSDEDDFSQTARQIESKAILNEAEQDEMKTLYRKLMKLYHPDQYMMDESKRKAYENISSLINKAKEDHDLETLRILGSNPERILNPEGLKLRDFEEDEDIARLQRLYESLQADILATLEKHNSLRESTDFELATAFNENPSSLAPFLARQTDALTQSIQSLEDKAQSLAEEIESLTGTTTTIILAQPQTSASQAETNSLQFYSSSVKTP